jgi:phosphoglycerate dehydrogenase-like enzyme
VHIGIGFVSESVGWDRLPPRYVDRLRVEFPQHTFLEASDRHELRRVLPSCDAALAPVIDRTLLSKLTRLRWVQAPSGGINHFLFPELVASQIAVTSARGIRTRAIAEHVLLMTLALARQLRHVLARQAEHVWAQDEFEGTGTICTLQGRQMGIVGLGAIGTEVARLAAAVGMRVCATRRHVDAPKPPCVERVLPTERLPELLAESDVIVLAAPLTPETELLIGREALGHVKRGALLINVTRMRLIDEAAFIEALADGRLGGAALDVFTREPLDPSNAYWDMPNVIITPHVCGAMEDFWTPFIALFAENLRRFERNEPLLNVVDKASGY